MIDEIVTGMFRFAFLILFPFGPAALYFWKVRKTERLEPPAGVLVWTAFMLGVSTWHAVQSAADTKEICRALDQQLEHRYRDMSPEETGESPDACHPEDAPEPDSQT